METLRMPPALPWILGAHVLVSAIAFAAYGIDKRRARAGARRIPERTLQGLALLGGWPGALLGRRAFRHKTRKRGFSLLLYLIAALHVASWVWFLVA